MKTIYLAIALFAISFSTKAQTTTASINQTVTLNLQNQIDISLGTVNSTSFTFASAANYATGLEIANVSQFNVRSNKGWNATVHAANASFSSSATTTMPASVLGVRLAGSGSYSNLSSTAANLTSGSRGASSFTVDYKANPGFDYDAGAYTLSVVYTATQQ